MTAGMLGAAAKIAALDATGQAELVRRGEVSAAELVEWAIERVEQLNPQLNAVITTTFDRARRHARGPLTGPFAGVPYLLKDIVAEDDGVRFTEGSAFLRDNVSGYTSELVRRLRTAGLVVLGKTNTPEFGMVPACEPALHGATRNPWDRPSPPAGPAAGLRPRWHQGWSRWRTATTLAARCGSPRPRAGCSGSNRRGRGCRSARSTATRSAAGPSSTGSPTPSATAPSCSTRPRGRCLATRTRPRRRRVPTSPRSPPGPAGCGSRSRRARPAERSAIRTAPPPSTTQSRCSPTWATRWSRPTCPASTAGSGPRSAPCSTRQRRALSATGPATAAASEPRTDELEPLTRAYWAAGRRVSAADYLLAVEDLQVFAREAAAFLGSVDCWLTPTMSEPPALLGEITSTEDEPRCAAERGGRTVAYSAIVANITGNPAMSVPLWWNAAGLPIGVHVLGRYGGEDVLFRLAGQLERARPWTARRPAMHALAAR